MAVLYEMKHTTTYRYTNPVNFGTHRALFVPQRGARARLLNWSATTSPSSKIRWISDALFNTVAVFEFAEPAQELTFNFQFQEIFFGTKEIEAFPLETRAEHVPVQYTRDEYTDLVMYMVPQADDHDHSVAAWAKSFVADNRNRTVDVLQRMLDTFRDDFKYNARDAQGTQSPGETLRLRSGTCRDYAWLMIEALRRLGFAARFISGYLYDTSLDSGHVGMVGSGATHAWLHVYLPGAGWRPYDPTNHINAGYDLIAVAVARHPGQAIPLEGSWTGKTQDYLGMSVNVAVHKLGDVSDPSEG
jgi:transglutaminase-like putative cysteine protease